MTTRVHEKSGQREATINFRCPAEWKRRVTAAIALRGETMQAVGVVAISQYLDIPVSSSDEQTDDSGLKSRTA